MEFLEGTSFEEAANKQVLVIILGLDQIVARTFINDGELWVDLVPRFNRKYIAPVPEDAVISRNDENPDAPAIGIFITPTSELGVAMLVALKGRSEFPPDHKPVDPGQN
jgi:hypothetical protein